MFFTYKVYRQGEVFICENNRLSEITYFEMDSGEIVGRGDFRCEE